MLQRQHKYKIFLLKIKKQIQVLSHKRGLSLIFSQPLFFVFRIYVFRLSVTYLVDIYTDAMRVEGAEVQASPDLKLHWIWSRMQQIQNVQLSRFIGE